MTAIRLKDKVAIVTGGGTGIGRAIALQFVKEGVQVVICGRREEPLQQALKDIHEAGGEGIYCITDVSSSSSVDDLVETTMMKFGQIDILVNNAGVYSAGDIVSTEEEVWDEVIHVDLKGVYLVSKKVVPQMLMKESGKIINIASIAGLVGFANSAAYCAAKGAVVNLTRQMALDFGGRGIRVNAIAPGVIDTDMSAASLSNEESKKGLLGNIPLGRIGTPGDIASVALFLASNESDYITGQTLVVDGGWIAK